MRNIARISRREIIAHRQFDVGMTASVPSYEAVDSLGHKEWVVDVYLGPSASGSPKLLKKLIIVPTAKQLIGDIRQPVLLDRSKQGKFTVVGRAKIVPAGAQGPDDSILDPTYSETKVNLTDLGLLFLADLDYEIGPYGVGDYGVEGQPLQTVKAWDAFGHQIIGDGVDLSTIPAKLSPVASRRATTRHLKVALRNYGEGNYGEGDYAGIEQTTLEHTE